MDDFTNPKFRNGPNVNHSAGMWADYHAERRRRALKRIAAAALLTLAIALTTAVVGTWATKAIGQAAYDAAQYQEVYQ